MVYALGYMVYAFFKSFIVDVSVLYSPQLPQDVLEMVGPEAKGRYLGLAVTVMGGIQESRPVHIVVVHLSPCVVVHIVVVLPLCRRLALR
eukprot:SAG11_NODE_6448_length_1311_cov_1.287129_1_plen_90_part_00